MSNPQPPLDGMPDPGNFTPAQLAALASVSGDFATARRLTLAIASADSQALVSIMAEIATGDPVAVALAACTDAAMMAQERYGDRAVDALTQRAARQLDLAEHNRQQYGTPDTR
jgi:hypothetical protein